jgi:YVTN family beta-propeller protein
MRSLVTLFVSSFVVVSVGCAANTAPNPVPGSGNKNCTPSANLSPSAASVPLAQRAYVVSRDSGDVTVIDLEKLEILGNMETCGEGDHMGELNADFTKFFVDSPGTHESIVVDTQTLAVRNRIPVGAEPTHLSLSKDGKFIALVNEWDDTVSVLDPISEKVIATIDGFFTPHFVRWAPDGKYAYVANLNAHHISRVDLATWKIDRNIVLDGFDGPPNPTPAPEESGFADAQIDNDGVLYAAHAKTGKVLVYDTVAQKKLGEIKVGNQPWIVYAEHPFKSINHRLVPNFGDQTVTAIAKPLTVSATIDGADRESYGVNYSPLVPDRAYVMNRTKNEIAVVDTATGARIDSVPVGGTTETASTTADGKYIVAAVSSANRVVVIEATTGAVVKTFDNVGKYPWSVTIPLGQNYCH